MNSSEVFGAVRRSCEAERLRKRGVVASLANCSGWNQVLETIAAIGGSYDEIKQEILLAYGQTTEQIWHDLIQVKQQDEFFRQLSAVFVARAKIKGAREGKVNPSRYRSETNDGIRSNDGILKG